VIADGTFLISSANADSSRALVTAGLPYVKDAGLEVLIGGLGLGYALDEALLEERVGHVAVVEFEPLIVDWFRRHGGRRAERLAEGEAAGRVEVVVADVADVMGERPAAFDLVALDTDNGPDWLVRGENADLYETGVALAQAALRPGGAAVFWSPERYDWFAARLASAFSHVHEVAAHDEIGGRRHEYTMYVAVRAVDPRRLRARLTSNRGRLMPDAASQPLALFPLGMVVVPGRSVHIFEERQLLVNERREGAVRTSSLRMTSARDQLLATVVAC
jgi:spermidine synthase